MKPRDLMVVVERVRRATSNADMVTICDALSSRLVREMADAAAAKPANEVRGLVPDERSASGYGIAGPSLASERAARTDGVLGKVAEVDKHGRPRATMSKATKAKARATAKITKRQNQLQQAQSRNAIKAAADRAEKR